MLKKLLEMLITICKHFIFSNYVTSFTEFKREKAQRNVCFSLRLKQKITQKNSIFFNSIKNGNTLIQFVISDFLC